MYSERSRRSRSRSRLQARKTATASWSSVRASSRCSSVAYSCRRSLATASARCRVCSNRGDSIDRLLLLQRALQRMFVTAGEIDYLRHLRLGDFVSEDAADADAAPMDVHHDPRRFLAALAEEPLQDVHDELHRRVVVIQQKHLVHRGLLRLRLALDDDTGPLIVPADPVVVAHRSAIRSPRRHATQLSEHDMGSTEYAQSPLRRSFVAARAATMCRSERVRHATESVLVHLQPEAN